MSGRRRRRPPASAILVLLAAGVLWAGWLGQRHLAGAASPLDRVEAAFADLRLLLAGPKPPPAGVAIVAIDDAAVAAEGRYPLDRARLADVVTAIANAGATALAVDMLLVDQTNGQSDGALAAALATIPTVLAAAGQFAPAQAGAGPPATSDELVPLPMFSAAADVGLVNVSVDEGGTPRHMPMLFRTAQGLAPSFALRAAALHAGADPVAGRDRVTVGGEVSRLDLGWHLPLRYLGPARTVPTVPALDLLRASAPEGLLRGRVVVLGVTATGVGDRFATPFDSVLPGVEVLATGIAHLLDGSGLVRDSAIRRIDAATTLLLVGAGVLSIFLLPLLAGAGLFAALLAGWAAAVALLFAQGWWFSLVLPLAGALPPVAAAAVVRHVFDRRQARRSAEAETALARLQAPVLARRIADEPDFLREPREQQAAIVFVDLSGFSGLSERIGPARTREFLKRFHELVVAEARRHGGFVMSFMGDGAMLVFGVPDEAPDDAGRALAAAFGLVAATRAWRDSADEGEAPAGVRVGVHFGAVVVSRLGHDTHQHIAATGDAVNVASRLMEACKERGAAIAASASLLEAAAAVAQRVTPHVAPRQSVTLRGRSEPVDVAFWDMEAAPLPAP
jgi:adenylate cyclase